MPIDLFGEEEKQPIDLFSDESPETTKPYTFWQAMKDIPVIEEPGTNMVPTKKGAIIAARGVAEQLPLAGMTVGGLVTGTATLPAGPVAIPASIAGGILGYAMGEKGKHIVNAGLDWLEGKKSEKKSVVQEMVDSGVDLVAGAEMTAGGMVLNRFIFEPVFRGGAWGFRTIQSYLKKTGTPGLTEHAAEK
jgi:hypothetical protein